MKNLDTKEWEFTEGEKYAIKWLEDRGYDVVIEKRYISKTIFIISKDGVSYKYHLPLGDSKIKYKGIMEQFEISFELYSKLKKAGLDA